jgi:chemotaxis protein CheY-P-specific phosphatase CheC
MEQQKRIDKILEAVEARVQSEVGTLLGADFTLVGGSRELVTKAEAFDRMPGKQICAHLDITGDITGKGCLLVGVKDAIRLGGTLIMLPDSELQEVIGREEYREEIADSYGEIANIIAGSFTKDFEEMYPKSCRFVRKEQELVVPAKVVIASDSPVADETFYLMSSAMLLDGRQLGDMIMLLPATTFGFEQKIDALAASPVPPAPQPEVTKSQAVGGTDFGGQDDTAATAGDPSTVPEPAKTGKIKIDSAKQQKKIDRLLADCEKRMAGEISALLGVDVVLDGMENRLTTKKQFFAEQVAGKQVLTDMEVVGDCQDTCYFSVGIKDAIHLGGILIMLPPTELLKVVGEEEFGDDARDAYGEVVNIVSGVYTTVFEEQYSQKLRFIKKGFREVSPRKVDPDSDEPIPNSSYYTSTMQLAVEGKQLGTVHMLFPAAMLQLDSQPSEDVLSSANETVAVSTAPAAKTDAARGTEMDAAEAAAPAKITGIPGQAKAKALKQKKLVDKILASCREKMEDEVSSLLGADVKLTNQENRIVNKEGFFFEEVSGKQVIADMDVLGELEGKSYLVVNLRDAIRIGGVLIMLPALELETVVTSEVFGEDSKDAYGEIANIIAGVYTGVFEEQYSKKIRFVKTGLQQIVPMKVEADSEEPFANGDYYLSSQNLTIGESVLGKVNILFPLALLELEGLREEEPEEIVEVEDVRQKAASQVGKEGVGSEGVGSLAGRTGVSPDILLIGDDEAEAAKISAVLRGMGYAVKSLSFKDNVHNYIPGDLKAIYLVMKDVNEQAFGAAIKISSACSLPLVAAGPGWTRTKVIKAVKYGIGDILLTPASKEDIAENVSSNLLKLAA